MGARRYFTTLFESTTILSDRSLDANQAGRTEAYVSETVEQIRLATEELDILLRSMVVRNISTPFTAK